MDNFMELKIKALSINEAFARNVVCAFVSPLDPNIDELNEIKTALSEAVTNCIVHAYASSGKGEIVLNAIVHNNVLTVTVTDSGVGIEDIDKARQPFYTTKPNEERTGMGITVMENFMDSVSIVSAVGKGTTVTMTKKIKTAKADTASARA